MVSQRPAKASVGESRLVGSNPTPSAACSDIDASRGIWKGKHISVSAPWGFCPIPGHALEPVRHYGEAGTGFLMCSECGGIASEPQEQLAVGKRRSVEA